MRAVIDDVSKDATAEEIGCNVPTKWGEEKLHGYPKGGGKDDKQGWWHYEAVFIHCQYKRLVSEEYKDRVQSSIAYWVDSDVHHGAGSEG